MQQIQNISPSTINQAILLVAFRYGVIEKSIAFQGSWVDIIPTHEFMPRIIQMINLTKTIEASGGRSANTNKEYFKILHQFVVQLAQVKQMSSDAIYEVIITEVNSIQKNIEDNLLRAKTEQKEFEKMVSLSLKGLSVMIVIVLLFTLVRAGVNTVGQRVLNTEEVNRLRIENAQLKEDNIQLKTAAKEFDKFKKERSQLENLKTANQNLIEKNSELNNRIIQCKKPFWERDCN